MADTASRSSCTAKLSLLCLQLRSKLVDEDDAAFYMIRTRLGVVEIEGRLLEL